MICPECHESAKFVGYRDSGVRTLVGSGRHERPYYRCGHCGHGWFPTDNEMGIAHKQSPACREVISLAGTVEPFAEAAEKLLYKLSGLNVSASTVQITTERVGNDLAQRRAAGKALGPARPWDWHRDANGKRVAYVSLDATAVLQQGPHAEKAEARMPWVGSVFNPVPMHERKRTASEAGVSCDCPSPKPASHEPLADEHVPSSRAHHRVWPTRYVCGVMSLADIGQQLRAECAAVGIANADLVIGVTDGGNGLEPCLVETVLAGLAREMVLILDFFHVTEHLRAFAKTWLPDDQARRDQVERWCQTLKHQGGAALLAELESLELTAGSEAHIEAHRLLTSYLRNNQHRIDYPTYLANGWEIGSGEIESACQNVINHRLGGAGMRWRLYGTTATCQVRSLYRSEFSVWQHYWNRTVPI